MRGTDLSPLHGSVVTVRLRVLALVALALTAAAFTDSQTVPRTTKSLPVVELSAAPVGWVPGTKGGWLAGTSRQPLSPLRTKSVLLWLPARLVVAQSTRRCALDP